MIRARRKDPKAVHLYPSATVGARKIRQNKPYEYLNGDRVSFPVPLLTLHASAEQRLLRRGELQQYADDLGDFHFRSDGLRQTIGSAVMLPTVAISKLINAAIGELSDKPAEPLGDGPIKYVWRDTKSAIGNTLGAAGKLVTLHPIQALGRGAKAVVDGLDVVFPDTILDLGSDVFGHINRKTRHSASSAFATAA